MRYCVDGKSGWTDRETDIDDRNTSLAFWQRSKNHSFFVCFYMKLRGTGIQTVITNYYESLGLMTRLSDLDSSG